MHKTIALRLAIAALLSGAAALTAGAHADTPRPGLLNSGDYAGGPLGSEQQPARVIPGNGSVYQVGKWPTYTAELAAGPGRDTVLGNCSMCHSVTYITMQPPLPAATWDAEVHKMIKTFGAPIQDAQAKEIITYLQTHYTPQTRKE
jgi:mono/diheme cytochrome c family protein